MGIVEQMRSFESDHEPDGWPAVTMGQISALCDEIERLQSIIDAQPSPRITEQDADKNDPIFTFVAQHYPLTAEHVESIYRECVRLIESRYSPN